jgi:hypothetical protein
VIKSIKYFLAITLILSIGAGDICLAQLQDMDNTLVNAINNAGPQYNSTIAINYQNPANAVIVWQDMAMEYRRVGYAFTHDGGQSWSDGILDLPSYPSQSEPSIVADSNGNFYSCMIGSDTDGQSNRDIIVLKSTDGGMTWSDLMVAVPGSPDYHDIMPKITVDNTSYGSRGFIYVVWVRYADDMSASLVYSTQSSDSGHTFLPPVQVSDNPGIVQWPNVNIRSAFGNGDVDVCWFRYHYPGILFDHSVTEGWSFGSDYWPTVTGAFNNQINGGIVVSTTPVMAADNQSGSSGFEKAYMVYMDSSNSNWDVYCIGITSFFDNSEYIDFSSPVRVNDDTPSNGADQFMPAMAVDETGTIHVVFFDRRNDPDNLLYDVYYTSSSDFGDTWTPNVRVSNVSSDPALPDVAGQIGNRLGIAAWRGNIIITWTDTRNGNTDVYASHMLETGITEEPVPLPSNINLDDPYPNPFNSSVKIRYTSNSVRQVKIDVVDLLGCRVANLFDRACQAGSNSIIWNGKNSNGHSVGSGVYFVRMIVDSHALLKKVVLLK